MKSLVALLALLGLCLAQEPVDPYETVTYNVRNDQDEICATFTLAAQFIVPYERSGDAGNGTIMVPINLPAIPGSNTTGDISASDCPSNTTGRSEVTLRVEFSIQNMFTMVVGEPREARVGVEPNMWQVNEISFTYNLGDPLYFPDSTSDAIITARQNDSAVIAISASNGELFQCNSQTTDSLPVNNGPAIEFNYKDMLLNPFNTTSSETNSCEADKSSSSSKTVPIAVGASLGALLVIVFLAYIIGRRMRKSSGYQKV